MDNPVTRLPATTVVERFKNARRDVEIVPFWAPAVVEFFIITSLLT
jgi:hypothetical protein